MSAQQSSLPSRITHRTVAALAWPLCVSHLSYTAMTVADAIFVGQLGTAHLAAIGLAGVAAQLISAFGLGTLGAVRIRVAQATGAADAEGAHATAWAGLAFAAIFAAVSLLFMPVAPALLSLLGAQGPVLHEAQAWLTPRLWASPFLALTFAFTGWFQGQGDTRTPMVANVLANVANIILDPLLIHGWGPVPAMGTAGAGWATLIGYMLAAGVLGSRAWGALLARPVRPARAQLNALWQTGRPIGVTWVLEVLAYGLLASVLARVGEAHVAAHVITVRVIMVSFLPGHALGEATSVLVGQAVGARRPDLARQAWGAASRIAVGIMGTFALLFLAFPTTFIAPFGASEAVASLTVRLLALAALLQILDALAMVALGALNGAGDTRWTMRVVLFFSWGIKVPGAALLGLGLGWGAVGAWTGILLEVACLAGVLLWRVRGDRWLTEATAPAGSAQPTAQASAA